MKKLIIAEKPSLARAIMKALEKTGEAFTGFDKGEYYSSSNYYVTAQFGHLLELKSPEEYPENKGRRLWEIQNLPFFPSNYSFNVKKDAEKRLNTIRTLVNLADVEEILHCGDPDREGQVLVDLVLREVGNKKPVTRPQLKALTDEAIIYAIDIRSSNEEYKNIRNEGLARMYFDWDYGINLSRYATIKTFSKPALNVGRVVGAICSEIYDRDEEIENFVPEKYFKVKSDINGLKLVSSKKFAGDKWDDANDYARELQSKETVVDSIETKPVKKQAPKLFSQTTLQAIMNKQYDYAPAKTMKLAQSLYEKGLTTYPRTNTEYLSEEEKDVIRKIIDTINSTGLLEFKDKKTIFDSKKIDSHSAIIITGKKPGNSLSEDEMNCYKTILNRFRAVFCKEDCIYNKTTMVISNSLEKFSVSGEVLETLGWQAFEPPKKKKESGGDDEDGVLPKLSVGEKVETDFKPVETETTPPKHHTIESLGKWMQNPFSKEDSTDEELYKNILAGLEIGTEATRAGILEKAEKKEYIEIKGKSYLIKPRGKFLVETCRNLGIDISKEKTAEMGKAIKDISKGSRKIVDVLNEEREYIYNIISQNKEVARDSGNSKSVGICPICKRPLFDKDIMVACSGWSKANPECNFKIWKTCAGKTLTDKNIQDILSGGLTSEIKGFKKKDGGTFSAKLRLKDDMSGVEFAFDDRERGGKPVGICPKCGSQVLNGKDYYYCSNKAHGCPFSVKKIILGKKIPESQIKTLLMVGGTNKLRGFTSKKGKKFSASLKIKDDGTGVEFDFV